MEKEVCQMCLRDCMFENNRALKEGGVIKFDSFWPQFINCNFANNSAPYGSIFGSYPVETKLSISLINSASG